MFLLVCLINQGIQISELHNQLLLNYNCGLQSAYANIQLIGIKYCTFGIELVITHVFIALI